MELAIDTSTGQASIALSYRGQPIVEMTWQSGSNHTATTFENLQHLLKRAEARPDDLDAVAVARGPGSFNGLRTALSIGKGLAVGLRIPIVGIGTLELEAYPYAWTGLPIVPMLPAGRGQVATALFRLLDSEWKKLREEHVSTPEEVVHDAPETAVFCGNMPPETTEHVRRLPDKGASVVQSPAAMRRASYLAELAWQRLYAGQADDVTTLEPLYLRAPSITTSQKRQARL